MKKKYLIWVALIGGAYLLMAMKKKKKGYKITVPEPDKITEEEFYSTSQKLIEQEPPAQTSTDQSMFGFVGRFPDLY